MSNVVRLAERVSRPTQADNPCDSSQALMKARLQIEGLERALMEHLGRQFALLTRTISQAIQIADAIKDEDIRVRLSSQAVRIKELVEAAEHRVAKL